MFHKTEVKVPFGAASRVHPFQFLIALVWARTLKKKNEKKEEDR
jgi:hypothetical protein